ncbi:hypothetical protein GCM10007939_12510 [Amylibacter marinus]|uniref:Uncharacterized protein n=1 Tax=Amylibacter marinus TaxID=1475483 RepID=A0ABQ5VUR7_9RHOB|nr:Lin0512 family protein [Amylibacter marinus]GLQ34968.1 hypothetical protein GCM10007939_12510 [Amylibacter marinus]
MKRIILEMGMGNDLYGQDYTKAAIRAVEDAFRHSTLSMFSTLGLDPSLMEVRVSVGAQNPDAVDVDAVAATLPRGRASVRAVLGGQDVENPSGDGPHVIVSAAIEAYYPIEATAWKLSNS